MIFSRRKYAICYWILCALFMMGCNTVHKTDWRVNLSRKNKNPYGLYLAYNGVNQLFHESKIETINEAYDLTLLRKRLQNDAGNSFVILIGAGLSLNDKEANSLIEMIKEGMQVMVVSHNISENLMSWLDVRQNTPELYNDSALQCIHFTEDGDARDYCYKGYSVLNYFEPYSKKDKSYYVLGQSKDKGADFIVYSIGKGKLFLHTSPFAFSNYFLLQHNNHSYLDKVFSYITPVKRVIWMDYNFRYAGQDYSGWSILWRNTATRAFMLIAIFALLLYVLFEMKRKQKIIPVIAPNTNTSVAFVETIGRLYYNTGNHLNLSEKMVQHFLEYVRSNYYLSTSVLDDEFERMLAAKSGKSLEKVIALLSQIKAVQKGIAVDDAFLFSLHSNIQEFYT